MNHPTEVNYELTWVAVQGLSPDQALAALKRELSDNPEVRDAAGWPDFLERRDYHFRIFMGQLPGGWLLLFGDLDEKDRKRLERLVKLGPAFLGEQSSIGCYAEGHAYADGKEVWGVDYDLESYGRGDFLKVEGDLPEDLATIIGASHAATAMGVGRDNGVDLMLHLPGKLSKAVCGFSPAEDPPEGFRWSMLQRIGGEPEPKPKPKGFFARLFGRS